VISSTEVSVVVPAYNAARYVVDAVASVLAQTAPPGEVIVVDDGSTDDTAAVLAPFGDSVRLVRQPHTGYAAAMNRGVAAASGSLLAFQDADDLWLPEKLERQVAALAADAELDAVFGRLEAFVTPDLSPAQAERFRVPPVMPSYQLQSMLIRRTAFDRVGALDPAVGTSGAIDWISRARAARLTMVMLDDLVSRRRIHDDNMGIRDADRRRQDLLDTMRTHRRRMGRGGDSSR
jgi:glycosyltransferase involved in cell wall biosynthesis